MKISVVIPVWNGERYIAQCIENVLCQTYKDLEIVVIDDGSTDGSAGIAARYAADHKRVTLISQPNRGLSEARNAGAEAATGDYIHFLDVDDLICREYYERMAVAATCAVGAADMVFGDYVNEALPLTSLSFPDALTLRNLEDKIAITNAANLGYAWRYMTRLDFIREHGLRFEPGRLVEDIAFTLEALARSGVVTTAPGATYLYMKRGGSILNTRDRKRKLRLKVDYKHARTLRAEFMAAHGLGSVERASRIVLYKVLGIPMAKKMVFNNGKTNLYILGVMVLRTKDARQ